MSSFWETKPIQTTIKLNALSNIIDQELVNDRFDLSYTILEDDIGYDRALTFINENYVTSHSSGATGTQLKYHYSMELFSWYVKKALVLEFTSTKHKKMPIGYIVGRNAKISVQDVVYDSMEVNFLCVLPRLRKMGLCGFMINVLTKEILLRHQSVTMAHYTISSVINSHYYCEKVLYSQSNRPDPDQCIDSPLVAEYVRSPSREFCEELYRMYVKYTTETYKVFEMKSFPEFEETFSNETFHHFVVRREGLDMMAYFCMFQLDIVDSSMSKIRMGNYYMVGFANSEEIPLYTNLVSQHVFENDIFDMVCFLDMFLPQHYAKMQFVRNEDSKVRYYMYNMISPTVNPWECGLSVI